MLKGFNECTCACIYAGIVILQNSVNYALGYISCISNQFLIAVTALNLGYVIYRSATFYLDYLPALAKKRANKE